MFRRFLLVLTTNTHSYERKDILLPQGTRQELARSPSQEAGHCATGETSTESLLADQKNLMTKRLSQNVSGTQTVTNQQPHSIPSASFPPEEVCRAQSGS